MELELHNGIAISRPTSQDIEREIRAACNDDGFFAILAQSEMTYMQVAGPVADGQFLLEHQIGSLAAHFETRDRLSIGQVIRAFQQYATGDDAWHRQYFWQRDEFLVPPEPDPHAVQPGTWEYDRHLTPQTRRGLSLATMAVVASAVLLGGAAAIVLQ
ncbi:MAG: hypothetical protein ACE5KM_24740 [Planctomycetaceae bacterium]